MQKNSTRNFAEPRYFLIILTVLLAFVILFYCVTSMIISVGYQALSNAVDLGEDNDLGNQITIILDAGHGGEDPGAVVDNVIEKQLNLAITNKLASFLKLTGFDVILTRTDDRLLYNSGEEDRKKYYDLFNRLKIAESYENAVFISIHMNKFPLEDCHGLQTFFTTQNAASQMLAQSIQTSSLLLDPSNHRQPKDSKEQIYLLKNMEIPCVLVECGFLSNNNDASNLSDECYQNKLAFSLYQGICHFLEEHQIEDKLHMQ